MKTDNVMLFIYDFPHKKTQDFIFRLLTEGYKIRYCIAAPWKKLAIEKPLIRVDHTHVGLIHPRTICKRFGIKYLSSDHNNKRTVNFIKKNPTDIYIISGARILSREVINACNQRVLNIHPGLLPEIRGLDTFFWSIYYNKPIGITAHFITPKIDSGMLIYKKVLPLYKSDCPLDITLRLLEYQTDILIKSLQILKKTDKNNLENLLLYKDVYNTKMKKTLEKKVNKKFKEWIALFANE